MRSKIFIVAGIVLILALIPVAAMASPKPAMAPLSNMEKLGEFLYFDENLSEPNGQSCASCHDPAFGFADPDSNLPVSEGVIPGLFGGRNSPISAYAMYSPIMYLDEEEELWIGGQFWDGRASGAYLGDPLADQAIGPFLNPVEMANTSKAQVINDIKTSEYAGLFEQVWGAGSLDDVDAAYDQVGWAIAAFERTQLFGQFSSKYDAYLAACINARGGNMDDCANGEGAVAKKIGRKFFTSQEWYGFQLFVGENNNDGILQKGEGAMCSACHVTEWTRVEDYGLPVQSPAWAPAGWVPPVFTDFSYDNLGLPKSNHMLLVNEPVDRGLGSFLNDPFENGKFRVMTVRNIGLSAPYAHNGYFMTLKEIVHFYNTRDVPAANKGLDWDMPEYADTVNFDELGNLGLNDKDEDALVAFMKTLSDGHRP